jgi:hypothetical protein
LGGLEGAVVSVACSAEAARREKGELPGGMSRVDRERKPVKTSATEARIEVAEKLRGSIFGFPGSWRMGEAAACRLRHWNVRAERVADRIAVGER